MKLAEEVARWKPSDLLLNDGIVLADYKILQNKDLNLPIPLHFIQPDSFVALKSSSDVDSVVVIYLSPLKVELYHENVLQISLNERALLHFDSTHTHSQQDQGAGKMGSSDSNNGVDRHGGKVVVDYGEDGKLAV